MPDHTQGLRLDEAPPTPAETPLIAVAVYRGETPLCALDTTGALIASISAEDRAAAAILLAQAALALASLPPVEPPGLGERVLHIVETLNGIGTPEAEAAMAALGDAAEIQTTALEMATVAIAASIPTTH